MKLENTDLEAVWMNLKKKGAFITSSMTFFPNGTLDRTTAGLPATATKQLIKGPSKQLCCKVISMSDCIIQQTKLFYPWVNICTLTELYFLEPKSFDKFHQWATAKAWRKISMSNINRIAK